MRLDMEKRTITLDVSPEAAEEFAQASPEDRQRAERAVSYALMSRSKAADALERILDALAEDAKASGLTEAKLDELLRDEADDEA